MICSICLDFFNNMDNIHSTNCGHLYHLNCLETCLKRKNQCPQCRYPFPSTNKIYLSFHEKESAVKDLELQLKSEFTKMREQFAECKKSLQLLQNQVQQLTSINETKLEEIRLKTLENEYLKDSLDVYRNRLQRESISNENISKKLANKIELNIELSLENKRLENQLKQLISGEQAETMKNAADINCNHSVVATYTFNKNQKVEWTDNSVFIIDFPVDQMDWPFENIIVKLANKMGTTILPSHLLQVQVQNIECTNRVKFNIIAQFKSRALRSKFLAKRNILINDSQLKCVKIVQFMDVNLK